EEEIVQWTILLASTFRWMRPKFAFSIGKARSFARASGRSVAAWRTGIIYPEVPFEICPMNGRKARESGLRLKATVAPTAVAHETSRARVSPSQSGPNA